MHVYIQTFFWSVQYMKNALRNKHMHHCHDSVSTYIHVQYVSTYVWKS